MYVNFGILHLLIVESNTVMSSLGMSFCQPLLAMFEILLYLQGIKSCH